MWLGFHIRRIDWLNQWIYRSYAIYVMVCGNASRPLPSTWESICSETKMNALTVVNSDSSKKEANSFSNSHEKAVIVQMRILHKIYPNATCRSWFLNQISTTTQRNWKFGKSIFKPVDCSCRNRKWFLNCQKVFGRNKAHTRTEIQFSGRKIRLKDYFTNSIRYFLSSGPSYNPTNYNSCQ